MDKTDPKPLAKLVRVVPPERKRKRWDIKEHMRWVKKVYGNKKFPSSDEQLTAARTDRKLIWLMRTPADERPERPRRN
jgi:hypothetical protein